MSAKILIGLAPKNHVILALDELQGLTNKGFTCETIVYGSNSENLGVANRLIKVIVNSFKIIKKLYDFKPKILYLNSRFEPSGSFRDFISIFIIKLFYPFPITIAIKSHGSNLSVFDKSLLYRKVIVPYLIKHVNCWFFLSNEEYIEILRKNQSMAKNVSVTSNIIVPQRFISPPGFKLRYGISPEKFIFLFVGRMVKEKGIFTILESISLLPFKELCEFIFIGSGNDLDDAKMLSSNLGINDNVKFIGFIPEDICDSFYSIGNVLVYPTIDSEGFPMALFKSVAAGMPVITTKIRAANDHLSTNVNVLWVTGGSTKDLSVAMQKIFYNKELRENISKNNKELGLRFSQDIVCTQMKASLLSSLNNQ